MRDIISVGEVLIDLTQTGTTDQGIPAFAANPGGAPANVAVAAARLGAETAFFGKVGRDSFGAYLRRDSLDDDLNWVYELFPRLKERSWQAAGTLSGGEQQMLAVARALMSRPKIIMMDEPSLGLAPLVVKGIFEIIQEINKQGVTVLLIEQNANMALRIADVAYVLETGKLTLSGSGKELLNNEQVKKAYLG